MSYCQFHPLNAATWHCQQCYYDMCDCCIDEGKYNNYQRCMACNTPVESLGPAYSATPFWQRMEESFRYPLKADAIALIIGVALVDVAVSIVPMAFIFQVLLLGMVFSFSFECLKQTAMGSMLAPDITSAYGKGSVIMLRLLLILTFFVVVVSAANEVFGKSFASLLLFMLVVAMPAVIIRYGLSESIMAAINPLAIISLISTIGMPYALILAFIMIMASSVGVINETLEALPYLSSILQSITSNYYMIVMFHIMGYMIFENQAELGFSARENNGEEQAARSEQERLKSRLQVYLKEGRYKEMIQLYEDAINTNINNNGLIEDCFRFLISSHNTEYMQEFASFYLEYLAKKQQADQLYNVYIRTLIMLPYFLPDTAEVRYALARVLYDRGDFKSAVKMLNGLHKAFSDFVELPQAYHLMAESLEALPNMQAQASKYRQFALKLEKAQS
jgi:tetratricopeptide (TPR) repeat protein